MEPIELEDVSEEAAPLIAGVDDIPQDTEEVEAPVGSLEVTKFVRPEQVVTASRYSSAADGPDFVAWGEGAIRDDQMFLTLFNSLGGGIAKVGDWVVKTDAGFIAVGYEAFEQTYNEV